MVGTSVLIPLMIIRAMGGEAVCCAESSHSYMFLVMLLRWIPFGCTRGAAHRPDFNILVHN
ncbi:hypothetical protein M758_4G120000 [Ceratodon purpureus]|nr:hypothetical protein M758_4G120000 [Ceratodon purpureus]